MEYSGHQYGLLRQVDKRYYGPFITETEATNFLKEWSWREAGAKSWTLTSGQHPEIVSVETLEYNSGIRFEDRDNLPKGKHIEKHTDLVENFFTTHFETV